MSRSTCALLLASIAGLARPASLRAAEEVIEMFQTSFLPPSVTIQLGDTVTWQWIRGTHTVTSGVPGGEPGTPDEPGRLFEGPVDELNPSFSHVFGALGDGVHAFFCREHPDDVGFVQISKGDITVRVAVVDNIFNPEHAYIFEGDSIRWEHEPMEDFHTVTSGRSSRPQDNPGALFDEESSDLDPIFVYTFEVVGDYPYFCIPHEQMGMTGTIHVQKKFLRGDTSGEGAVDISDAVAILNFLFLGGLVRCCDDAIDANDDGAIDIADPVFILNYLFAGTVTMPAPHPFEGPDRTEDSLLCME
jgi:plastocyanin